MVTAAILAAIMGASGTICIVTLYALHRLTGGKMSIKKWLHINFDFQGGKENEKNYCEKSFLFWQG